MAILESLIGIVCQEDTIIINMQKEFTTYGSVDKDGNLSIYNRSVFLKNIKDYFKSTSVELVFRERQYRFSDRMRGYYFGVLIKEIQKAWLSTGVIKSLNDIDIEMRDKFLYYEEVDEETGLYEKHLHTLKKSDTKVSKQMMREYCERCIIWTAQNLQWAIAMPSEEFTENDMTEHQRLSNNIGTNDKSTF